MKKDILIIRMNIDLNKLHKKNYNKLIKYSIDKLINKKNLCSMKALKRSRDIIYQIFRL